MIYLKNIINHLLCKITDTKSIYRAGLILVHNISDFNDLNSELSLL